jgi:hypothetical protein
LRAPLVFASHSWFLSIEDPLPELGAAVLVGFNDLTYRRLRAHPASTGADVVRLTQPVTVSYADSTRTRLAGSEPRAVAVSRSMREVPARLAEACAALGYAFDWVGGPGREPADAREQMRAADIVFAVGRTALEAMADGRATFVIDELTAGGWVTRASYAALEDDGFTGYVARVDDADVGELLARYQPELGAEARSLAVQHHAAPRHAVALVELYAQVADRPVASTVQTSLGRLAHERFALEGRAVRAEWRAAEARRELEVACAESRHALEAVRGDNEALRAELAITIEQRDRFQAQRDVFRRQRNRLRRALARREQPDRPGRSWLARLRRR